MVWVAIGGNWAQNRACVVPRNTWIMVEGKPMGWRWEVDGRSVRASDKGSLKHIYMADSPKAQL